MKKTGIVILTIALIAAICGSFYVVNDKSKRANQKEKVLTEVQRITTKDLDKNYPQTPREVVKLYNRIVKCYYGMQYSDEELDALTDQALKLLMTSLQQTIQGYLQTVCHGRCAKLQGPGRYTCSDWSV